MSLASDRAEAFSVDQLGFHSTSTIMRARRSRVVRVTPWGSACSITFGINVGGGQPAAVAGSTPAP